jgi:hypothetical protein
VEEYAKMLGGETIIYKNARFPLKPYTRPDLPPPPNGSSDAAKVTDEKFTF